MSCHSEWDLPGGTLNEGGPVVSMRRPRNSLDWGKGILIKLGTWGCASAILLGAGFVGVSRGGILLLATLLAIVLVCQVSVGAPVSSAGMGQCNGIE